MKEFKKAKEEYDNTPIPAELSDRVRQGIQEGRAHYRARRARTFRRWASAAACFCAVLAGLNLSPTIARAAAEVPVLGGLFQVLTFVDYNRTEDGIHYDVSVPQVEAESDLAQTVNAMIQEKLDATLAEGWVASMEERYYYNLDLAENRDLTLRDYLGEDWVEICNASIQKQIEDSVDEEGFTYFFAPEDGGFTTVDETTGFYVREDGTVVVCFPEYSIAAGAAGMPEFPIS